MSKKILSIPGINIQFPWSELILEGVKVVETRNYTCPKKFLNTPILLVETPGKEKKFKARIVGLIIINNSFEYSNLREYVRDTRRHHVNKESNYFWKEISASKFGWEIKKILKFSQPIEAPSKRGYVWTGSLDIPKDVFTKRQLDEFGLNSFSS